MIVKEVELRGFYIDVKVIVWQNEKDGEVLVIFRKMSVRLIGCVEKLLLICLFVCLFVYLCTYLLLKK